MSINFENEGTPIAIITSNTSGDAKTRKQSQCPIVCVTDKKSGIAKPFTELSLQDKEDQQFQLIPNPETERQILYVTGSSGSGKSYFTRKYCNEFSKIFPKRPIYLFSSISDDDSIDAIKGLKRIKLKSKEFLEEDFDINDFKDCLVIFDDTDVIPDKKLRNKVNTILGMVLETGRHTNTYCIYTSHLACAGNDTKRILNEAHSITFFPNTAGGRTLKYLCDSYLGLDKKEVEHIKRLPSRWVTILKTYPKVVVSEKDLFLLSSINK